MGSKASGAFLRYAGTNSLSSCVEEDKAERGEEGQKEHCKDYQAFQSKREPYLYIFLKLKLRHIFLARATSATYRQASPIYKLGSLTGRFVS